MTKRSQQFPVVGSSTIPTGPLKTLQQKMEPEPQTNPLAAFFRKNKLSLTLPSHGNWYPKNSLTFNISGQLPVFAMNASDDMKFRTGDATMTGKNIYEVIQSCIPNIQQPDQIPNIDIDAILLAIRVASYGSNFDFVVSVPKTTLTRTIQIDANDLLRDIANRTDHWDEEINIEDETGQVLSLLVQPIPMKNLFDTSKNIFMLRKSLTKNFDQDENIKDEGAFSNNMNSLTISAIDLLCSSIKKLSIIDSSGNTILNLSSENLQDSLQIKQTIHQIDIAYFNSIRDHIDMQRKKYVFMSSEQISTEAEINAGAPEKWTTELTFMGSNFLPETKTLMS
jgi:hypothetical protein